MRHGAGPAANGALADAPLEPFDIARLRQQLQPFELSGQPSPGEAEMAYFRYYGLDFEREFPGLEHRFGHYPSGRFEIVAHYFLPPRSRGTCFVLHGYFDHVGLYRHVIEFCLRRGLAVVAWDLPGHGLSTGERASIGDFSEYRQVLEDSLRIFHAVAPKPWSAIAQSTGGAVLMDHLLRQPDSPLERNVLLAPLVRPRGWYWMRVIHPILRLVLQRVPRRFGGNSGDAEFLDFVSRRDPLQSHHVPLDWVGAMLRWERSFHRLPVCETPMLVIQGARDLAVAWRFNLRAVRSHFPASRVLRLDTARHHLANETATIRGHLFSGIELFWSLADRGTPAEPSE